MRSGSTLLFLLSFVICSQQLRAQYISTYAGTGYGAATGTGGYTGDNGYAVSAELNSSTGVTFDGAGNVYIADRGNNAVRKINTLGIITTIAGSSTAGYTGDNGPAIDATLNAPYSVAVDGSGNVFIADGGNNVIRKINTAGNIITYAGNGTAGYSGDGFAASTAQMSSPEGISLDNAGNLYIADAGNHAIREVSNSGVVIFTIAGTGTAGYSGDGGPANLAQFNGPSAVATDIYGNLYIADRNNNAIRKITNSTGNISTIAGNGAVGSGGDNGPAAAAQLHSPAGVSIYGFGNIYISDQGNNVIRKIDTAGTITLFAGTYRNGYLGDGGLATHAEMSSPTGLAVDGLERVYIADYDNNVIRLVSNAVPAAVAVVTNMEAMNVYPNPTTGSVSITLPCSASATITMMNVLGSVVAVKEVPTATQVTAMQLNNLPEGTYLLKASTAGKTYTQVLQLTGK